MIFPGYQYHTSEHDYNKLYADSVRDPQSFWSKQEQLYLDNEVNITVNCLDRHLRCGGGDKLAYIGISEHEADKTITYQELLAQVNQLGNYLLSRGVKKGDTVTLYMPLVIEQVVAMLACARIGAIHSVVYAGFSAQALSTRIAACESKLVITADYTYRRGKSIALLPVVREATSSLAFVKETIVLCRESSTKLQDHEVDWQDVLLKQKAYLSPANIAEGDPLFILYTSGTTGEPKGVVHATRGYNLYTHVTTHYTFDLQESDIFWCTADLGWISGHSYVVYGPLSNHATIVIQEGVPDYPDASAWWKIIDDHKVTILYTSPTAIRLLMAYGNEIPTQYNLSSLRLLGSVGEPLNSAAWEWYSTYVGHNNCAIVDTWWQTETGGHMLLTLPGLGQKPGCVGLPFFGIVALIVDSKGNELPVGQKGSLVIRDRWPGTLYTCWHNQSRYEEYWHTIPPYFVTGDVAVKDEDGYIRVLGRSDDIIIVAGHNISSAELESVLTTHASVAEAGVVGVPDPIKGNQIIAFVTLVKGVDGTPAMEVELINYVGDSYGKHARPTSIKFVDKLPKTRSGKIMRRVLRAQVLGVDPGDTSTMESS